MSSGCALTVTLWRSSSRESAFVSANAGTSVLNSRVPFDPRYRSFCVNVPWIAVPFDVISATWPARTWSRKNGLYGTRTRDSACVVRDPAQ